MLLQIRQAKHIKLLFLGKPEKFSPSPSSSPVKGEEIRKERLSSLCLLRLILSRFSGQIQPKISNIFTFAIFIRCFENRLGDRAVSAATTDVPGEPFGDLLARGPGIFH